MKQAEHRLWSSAGL